MMNNILGEYPDTQAWYKVGMMWLAVGLPAIVVVASLVTVVIAHKNAPLIIPSKTEAPAKPQIR